MVSLPIWSLCGKRVLCFFSFSSKVDSLYGCAPTLSCTLGKGDFPPLDFV